MLNSVPEPFQSVVSAPDLPLRQTRRIRRTPFTHLLEASGVMAWSVYNHMLLPVAVRGTVEDYHHLKRAVQLWDVAAERQVEVRGPDAARLIQLSTPRRMDETPVLKCRYAPLCDAGGAILNDPLILRPDEDRWWVSCADTDVSLWLAGIAAGARLDVDVREPDVHPLAVQGPRAADLMERVFGTGVRDLKFFQAGEFECDGIRHVVARSGWSGQGGFEIFIEGWDRAEPMWRKLMAAGEDLDVAPGCPNGIERIEAGLLSYGNDMTRSDDPYQCGLGRYVDLDADSLSRDALSRRTEPDRMLRGLLFEGDDVPQLVQRWPIEKEGRPVGHVTSAANSPDFEAGIAIAMVDIDFIEEGTKVTVLTPSGPREADVRALPFKRAS